MTSKTEIILDGSYLYYQKGVSYSQENFKLVQTEDQHYHIYAEILSRIETGEFLKLLVRYEMTQNFTPYFMRIERSLGNKYAQETYQYDVHSQELHYSFQTPQHTQEFTKPHSSKHYLTSPALSTAAMFSLNRKFDATGRTPVTLVNSSNDWTYQGPPTDKLIFADFKSRELEDFKLNNTPLAASLLCLYENDTTHSTDEDPVELYLSKHYSVPYQLVHGDLKVVIKNLKRNS